MDLDEILNSAAFWILNAVGIGAIILMLILLKGMGNSEFMPLWVKIVALIAVPIVSGFLTGYASGD